MPGGIFSQLGFLRFHLSAGCPIPEWHLVKRREHRHLARPRLGLCEFLELSTRVFGTAACTHVNPYTCLLGQLEPGFGALIERIKPPTFLESHRVERATTGQLIG